MRERFKIFSKFIPAPPQDIESGADLDQNYKTFFRGLIVLLIVLVLIPSTIISVLSHYQYQDLLHHDEITRFFQHLKQSHSQVNQHLEERKALISFISRTTELQQLAKPDQLGQLLHSIRIDYPDITDLELINESGEIIGHAGEHQPSDKSYEDSRWLDETVKGRMMFSSFFNEQSDSSFIAVSVSQKQATQEGVLILRFWIESHVLYPFTEDRGSTTFSDIFIIDSNKNVLTIPLKYGSIGKKNPFASIQFTSNSIPSDLFDEQPDLFDKKDGEVTIQDSSAGNSVLLASTILSHGEFRLIFAKEMGVLSKARLLIRVKLIAIFVTCTIVAFLVILEISQGITRHIQESNKKRQLFLAEVEHSNKLASIGRLAAGIAHEINNPLSIINQKAGLIEDFIEMSEDFTHRQAIMDTLDGIQDSVLRCKTITHRLLGFARQEDVHTELLDINIILREVIDFLAKEATYAQIRIDFELEPEIPTILSDRTQLQQIFLNITSNAIDAIGSHGRILLSTHQVDEDHIQVNITDDGPGIDEEVKKHIFDPFFTTKETGKGTGLGLSITYGLVQKLGGKIEVLSEVGKGTTFEITFSII